MNREHQELPDVDDQLEVDSTNSLVLENLDEEAYCCGFKG